MSIMIGLKYFFTEVENDTRVDLRLDVSSRRSSCVAELLVHAFIVRTFISPLAFMRWFMHSKDQGFKG